MNLGDNLKKIRKENNLSQEQLAEKLGVSRQSVSKWESNLAYPEMDKVLQLCNMFDLNIDELLNQNVKEVKKNKQSKVNINKYIDSFLNFITKTIDMLSSMTFKNQIKCLIEQFVVVAFMFFASIILKYLIFDTIVIDLLQILPDSIYYTVFAIIKDLFLVAYIILCIILFLHIFKIRYLDYYEFSFKEDEEDNKNEKDALILEEEKINENKQEEIQKDIEEIKEKHKKFFVKKREKIIIRDPKHSEYKFISGLFKCLLLCVKAFVLFIELFILIGLIMLVVLLTLSFVIIKSGLLFVGIFISLLSLIIITIEVVLIISNFILDKKTNKNKLALYILVPFLTLPIGIGLSIMSIKDFNIVSEYDGKYIVKDEVTYKMANDLLISSDIYYLEDEITYIESDNKDVKIVFEHLPFCQIKLTKNKNMITYKNYCYNDASIIDGYKYIINLINNKVLLNPDYKLHTYVYSTKENIEKLKSNMEEFYESQTQKYYDDRLNELMDSRNYLINENEDLQNKNFDLRIQISDLEEKIEELQNQVKEYENIIHSSNKE